MSLVCYVAMCKLGYSDLHELFQKVIFRNIQNTWVKHCTAVIDCVCVCVCVHACVCAYMRAVYMCVQKYGGCVNQHLWVSERGGRGGRGGRVTLLDLEAIGEWKDLEHAKQGGL